MAKIPDCTVTVDFHTDPVEDGLMITREPNGFGSITWIHRGEVVLKEDGPLSTLQPYMDQAGIRPSVAWQCPHEDHDAEVAPVGEHVPQPNLCPKCGAYWRCEHLAVSPQARGLRPILDEDADMSRHLPPSQQVGLDPGPDMWDTLDADSPSRRFLDFATPFADKFAADFQAYAATLEEVTIDLRGEFDSPAS